MVVLRRLYTSRGNSGSRKIEATSNRRLSSVDALRGMVMILMALDHIRDFFNSSAMYFLPDDLTRTTPALFFTRWITHFCAPTFMFTAGIGAFLWWKRGRTKLELSRFLWTRGLWLVVLEMTALRLAFTFGAGPLLLTVLWALGWSMIILGFLVYLPIRLLAILSVVVIALHNLTDSVNASQFGQAAWLWNVLHQPGAVRVGGIFVMFAYPLVPWFAVMAAGYCFGEILLFDPERRRRWMIRIGLAATIAFIIIRGLNIYGDPQPWSSKAPGMIVLSFLKVTKYPPSLDFLLMTLGPAILLLALFERIPFSFRNPLIVFGRVPLFYFLIHLYVIHGLAVLFALLRYGHAGFMLTPLPSMGGSIKVYPPGFGYSLGTVYCVWLAVVVLMYPLCLWFADVKKRRRDWWLSYL